MGGSLDLFSRYFTKRDMYNHAPQGQYKGENRYANILQHKKWLDSNYMDKSMELVTGSLSSDMAKDGTENSLNNIFDNL